MKKEKITMSNVVNDLKNIRNYHLYKRCMNQIQQKDDLVILNKIKIYNELIKFATPLLNVVYNSLYIEGFTQETLGDKLGYTRNYIHIYNKRLIKYFYKIMNVEDFII